MLGRRQEEEGRKWMMNDEWQRESEQTTKRMLLLCVSVHDSRSRSLYSSRVSLHQTLLFLPVFQCTLLNLIIGLVPASFHARLLLFKHTNTAAKTLPPELLTHAFFFFFLPLFLTHTHTQMLSHTLSFSLRHTHTHIYSLFLSVTSSYF